MAGMGLKNFSTAQASGDVFYNAGIPYDSAGNLLTNGPTYALNAAGKVIGFLRPDGTTLHTWQALAQCGVPIGKPSSGSVAANGALTLTTAFDQIYSGGIWLYLPAGAAYAASAAGFYWVVMSSTTAGTIYNTTYTPGVTGFDIPASPMAIVAAGPGAFTGVTAEITAIQWTIPGGLLGNHGWHKTKTLQSQVNNTNNKTMMFKLADDTIGINNNETTGRARSWENSFQNRGAQTAQIAVPSGSDAQGSGVALSTSQATSAADTAADSTFSVTLQTGGITLPELDWIVLESCMAEVMPS